jgi:hypothetical protein
MNFTKTSFLFLLASVSLCYLAAKEYSVETSQDGVSCTLTTLTQEEMAALIGACDAFYPSANANPSIHTNFDPFRDATKNYMAIKVTIKNESSKAISLSRGEYLEGIENAYISKGEMIKMLYPPLNDNLNAWYWTNAFFGTLTGLYGLIFLAPVYWILGEARKSKSFTVADLKHPTFTMLLGEAVFAALLVITSSIFFYEASKKNNTLKLSNEKEKEILNSTFFKKLKKQINQFYASDTPNYIIPAKSEFHDLIFVDLSKIERDFLANIQPTLVVTEEK